MSEWKTKRQSNNIDMIEHFDIAKYENDTDEEFAEGVQNFLSNLNVQRPFDLKNGYGKMAFITYKDDDQVERMFTFGYKGKNNEQALPLKAPFGASRQYNKEKDEYADLQIRVVMKAKDDVVDADKKLERFKDFTHLFDEWLRTEMFSLYVHDREEMKNNPEEFKKKVKCSWVAGKAKTDKQLRNKLEDEENGISTLKDAQVLAEDGSAYPQYMQGKLIIKKNKEREPIGFEGYFFTDDDEVDGEDICLNPTTSTVNDESGMEEISFNQCVSEEFLKENFPGGEEDEYGCFVSCFFGKPHVFFGKSRISVGWKIPFAKVYSNNSFNSISLPTETPFGNVGPRKRKRTKLDNDEQQQPELKKQKISNDDTVQEEETINEPPPKSSDDDEELMPKPL